MKLEVILGYFSSACRENQNVVILSGNKQEEDVETAEGKGVKEIIVVLRIIIHQLAGKDFGEVKLSFMGDDGECPSSVVDRKNLKMR